MTRATLTFVRAAMVHPQLLDERSQLGIDRWDEVWDGVLHMVPPPSFEHQCLATDLALVLRDLVPRGLRVVVQAGVFESNKNYRVPDVIVADPAEAAKRGLDGRAELVVEVLSPGDESRNKFAFYASRGVREVWLFEPATRAIEVHSLRGDKYAHVRRGKDGVVKAPVFGLELSVVDGPKLRIRWADGSKDI